MVWLWVRHRLPGRAEIGLRHALGVLRGDGARLERFYAGLDPRNGAHGLQRVQGDRGDEVKWGNKEHDCVAGKMRVQLLLPKVKARPTATTPAGLHGTLPPCTVAPPPAAAGERASQASPAAVRLGR